MQVRAVKGLPPIHEGDDLLSLILAAAAPTEGDVVVVASKVVAKAQGRVVALSSVRPSSRALGLAEVTGKDPRVVELILRDSVGVSRAAAGVLIVRHRLGHVCANAGLDLSNVGPADHVVLLPDDPDGWAAEVRRRAGVPIGVIISDSVGRAFRRGALGTAIGVAGLPALVDLRGRKDLGDRPLEHSESPLADVLAAAADLVMGQADEGTPAAVVSGVTWPETAPQRAADLQRPADTDLYA